MSKKSTRGDVSSNINDRFWADSKGGGKRTTIKTKPTTSKPKESK